MSPPSFRLLESSMIQSTIAPLLKSHLRLLPGRDQHLDTSSCHKSSLGQLVYHLCTQQPVQASTSNKSSLGRTLMNLMLCLVQNLYTNPTILEIPKIDGFKTYSIPNRTPNVIYHPMQHQEEVIERGVIVNPHPKMGKEYPLHYK